MNHVIVIALFFALGAIAFITDGPAGSVSVMTGATVVWWASSHKKGQK